MLTVSVMEQEIEPTALDASTGTAVSHLECSRTQERLEAGVLHNVSSRGWPLLVRYDLSALRRTWDRDSIAEGPRSMWRYAPALPVRARKHIVSLREGSWAGGACSCALHRTAAPGFGTGARVSP